MLQNQDYRKSLFRRPLFTNENIRLWMIAIGTAVVFIVGVLHYSEWARTVPDAVLVSKIKENYTTFLIEETERMQGMSQPEIKVEKPEVRHFARVEPDWLQKKESVIEQSIDAIAGAGKFPQDVQGEEGSGAQFVEQLLSGDQRSPQAITSAVEGVAGYAELEESPVKKERSINYQGSGHSTKRAETSINIPKPKRFQFASQNGNRDLYETTAVMEMNEVDVRYCFDKVARYNPAFSGNVLVKFTIHQDGHVIPSSIKIVNSDIADPRVTQCIKRSIGRWNNFPEIAMEDGKYTVTRKYVF